MCCGALWFVFLSFVLGFFEIIDEVVDGNGKFCKFRHEMTVFFFSYVTAVESTVNLTSGFSAGAICYV